MLGGGLVLFIGGVLNVFGLGFGVFVFFGLVKIFKVIGNFFELFLGVVVKIFGVEKFVKEGGLVGKFVGWVVFNVFLFDFVRMLGVLVYWLCDSWVFWFCLFIFKVNGFIEYENILYLIVLVDIVENFFGVYGYLKWLLILLLVLDYYFFKKGIWLIWED